MPRSSHHDPVFVDRTGRRRRLVALGGTAGGLLLAVTLLALLAGFTGAGPAVLPDWSDAGAAAPRRTPARPAPVPAATPRADPADVDADAPRATRAVRTSSTATATATATVTVTAEPSVTRRGNGRTPTHTPSARPGRKR